MKKRKNVLVTVLASLLLSQGAFSAEQDHAVNNGSTIIVTSGNSMKFTAPAAGTDEIFTIADGVPVGEGGIVLSATTADGVGAVTFLGASVATGNVGAAGTNDLGIMNIGTANAVSISGTVNALDINITAAATVTFGGLTTGTTLDMTTGTLTAAGLTVGTITNAGGAITSSADITGVTNISVAGGSVTLGAGAKFVGAIDNTSGGAGVGSIDIGAIGGNLTVASSTIGASNAMLSVIVDTTGGVATFTGNVVTQNIQINGTGTANFGANLTLSGTALTNNVNGATTVTGVLAIPDNYNITVGSNLKSGDTVFTATGGYTGGTTAGQIDVTMPANFTSGTMTLINDGNGAIAAGEATALSFNTDGLAVYSASIVAQTIVVTATTKSSSTLAATYDINEAEADALVAAAQGADSTVATALKTALGTVAGAQLAAKQVNVQQDTLGASVAATTSVSSTSAGVNSGRLAVLRSDKKNLAFTSGYATGNNSKHGAWAKAFGYMGDQDERENVAGYESDTFGLTVGYDRAFNSKVNGGVSVTVSDTEVEGRGAGFSSLNSDGYVLSFYGDYSTEKYFFEGLVAFGLTSNTTSRRATFGGLDETITGEYDGMTGSLYAAYGRNYKLGSWDFVPMGSFLYTYVKNDDYTEDGGGSLNLVIGNEATSVAVIKISSAFSKDFSLRGDKTFTPEFRVGIGYDVMGDEANATANFQGQTTTFEVSGADVAQLQGSVGVGASFDTGSFVTSVDYDLDMKADFTGHQFALKGKYEF